MVSPLAPVLRPLFEDQRWAHTFGMPPVADQLVSSDPEEATSAAFLTVLAGERMGGYEAALDIIEGGVSPSSEFYRWCIDAIPGEMANHDDALGTAASFLADTGTTNEEAVEALWRIFCPQAAGIRGHESEQIAALRAARTVIVEAPSSQPIQDASRQVLLTANVLLSTPLDEPAHDLPESVRMAIAGAADEPQSHWYDHPVPIGVAPEANEVLYGLRALDDALSVERRRGNVAEGHRMPVALSVSVTHAALRAAALDYLRHVFDEDGGFRFIAPYVFTEQTSRRIVAEVLAPFAERALDEVDAAEALSIFGVDGSYGRHYTFLKALSVLWHLLDREVVATFKIDLDQVFPQRELIDQTGLSALEHLAAPLWGGRGTGARGEALELGLLAGALVNASDIGRGLFTPDVPLPEAAPRADELFFYSRLPQAISTEAEMMTRYGANGIDGRDRCLERVHVTGGTTGIRVDTLKRHRMFTPSFVGRAEDQAYLLSALDGRAVRPAYLHASGLIMRHDKAGFAGEAIAAAAVGKAVGDNVRIVDFSAYADLLGYEQTAELIDPFTGAFASRIPITVTSLRLAISVLDAFANGRSGEGSELSRLGTARLQEAHGFVGNGAFAKAIEEERQAWNLYYDTIGALETGIEKGDPMAQGSLDRLRDIVASSRLTR